MQRWICPWKICCFIKKGSREGLGGFLFYSVFDSVFRKEGFIYTAQGAGEIFGYVFPFGAGCDTAFGVADCFVIFPAACITYILHNFILRFKVIF